MIDLLTAAIDATIDEPARPRLRRCIPRLIEVLGQWSGADAAAPGLVLAVATPDSGVVLHADNGWPTLDAAAATTIERGDCALAIVKALESSEFQGEVVINGLAVLLGNAGLLAQAKDAEQIARAGKLPLTVALLEHSGQTVTVLMTTVEAPITTLH